MAKADLILGLTLSGWSYFLIQHVELGQAVLDPQSSTWVGSGWLQMDKKLGSIQISSKLIKCGGRSDLVFKVQIGSRQPSN